jgi:hypothetical protein
VLLGVVAEALMLAIAVALPQALGDQVANVLQAPGSYIVAMLAKAHRPGFEEQVGYVLLIPVIQWFVYSVLLYLWLARRAYVFQRSSTPCEVQGLK